MIICCAWPIQKRALTKLIVYCIRIGDKLCKKHRCELLVILALKHVMLDFDLGLFSLVFGTRFGNWLIFPIVKGPLNR